MHIIRSSRKEAESLAASILEIKGKIRLCERCGGLSDREVCDICNNPHRDESLLCVVEQPADMVAVEKSGAFKGKYHILQGALSPMNGIGPDAGAFSSHDVPIDDIPRHAFDKGPCHTHTRLHRMNGAPVVPKNTVTALSLAKNPPPAGHLAIIGYKLRFTDMNESGNPFKISF